MKLSFFAAVMLAINSANAVRIYSMPDTLEFEDDFAETEAHGQGRSHALSKGDIAAAAEAAVASAAD